MPPIIYGGLFRTCHYVTQEHSSRRECSFVCVLRVPDFQVEVQLDSYKHKQKGAVKRALFLDSQQPLLQKKVSVRHGERVCDQKKIYLRVRETPRRVTITTHIYIYKLCPIELPVVPFLQDEKDFRDKLSSIYVALNFSLDPNAAADSRGLRPILNYQTTNVIEQKVL